MTTRSNRVVVVGAGFGGLGVAGLLARRGLRPLILERGEKPGGRARSRTKDGFTMNLGPHALYRGGAAEALLAELDVAYEGHPPRVGGGLALVGDTVGRLPSGFTSLVLAGWLTLAERYQLAGALARLPRLETRGLERTSADAWIESNVSGARARDAVRAFFRVSTYCAALDRLPASVAISQLQAALPGVLYLDGGWQTLVDGLEARAIEGGAIRYGAKAERVVVEGGRVGGVRLVDGETIPADDVILCVDPDRASALLPEDTTVAAAAARAVPTIASCLDVALRTRVEPSRTFLLGIDRPYYASVHSHVAALAEHGSLVHVARYGGATQADGEAELWGVLEHLVPGARADAAFHRYSPSLTVSWYTPTASEDGYAARPPSRSNVVHGAHFVGDWVGPDGLLADAVAASARAVATDLGQRAELAA